MRGIYNYVPQTHHVCTVRTAAAILQLQFMLHVLLLLLLFIILMLAIYNYVPQTHHVCTVRTAAAILQLQFMLHVMLFPVLNVLHFYIITSRSVCVQCEICLISVVHYFMLSQYLARVFTEWLCDGSSSPSCYWYHFCFHIPHAQYLYCKLMYFRSFLAYFLITSLSPEIALSVNMHIPCHYHGLWCPVYC